MQQILKGMNFDRYKFLTLICVVFALTTTITSALRFDWTYDERFHIDWNQRLWDQGVTERESVYNYISTTPIILTNMAFSKFIYSFAGRSVFEEKFLLRLPTTAWLLCLLFGTYQLGMILVGKRAAMLAIAFLCFEPNILAHSSLVTVDVAFAAVTVLLLWSLLSYAQSFSWPWSLAVGFLVGCAFCIKFSAFLLLPLLAIIPVFGGVKNCLSVKVLSQLILGVSLSSLTICGFYLFIGVGEPLGSFHFFNSNFKNIAQVFSNLRLPLPRDFITGYDHLAQAGLRDQWNSIIFGQWKPQGSWYYFICLWFFKTPLILVGLTIYSIINIKVIKNLFGNRRLLFTLIFAFTLLGYFSLLVKVQVGFRYVLMCLPFFYMMVAAILVNIVSSRKLAQLTLVVMVLALVELIPFWRNTISFSNALIYPKKFAYKVLADSNIDWGQNRLSVLQEIERRGVGSAAFDPIHILAGTNIITINHLVGVFWDFDRFRWLRDHLAPIAHIQHTALIFEVPPAEFISYLKEERAAKATLHNSNSTLLWKNLAKLPLTIKPMSVSRQLIIKSTKSGLIRIEGQRGKFNFGQPAGEVCKFESIGANQEAWYYLAANSTFVFCIPGGGDFESKLESQSGDLEWQIERE